MTDKKQDDAGRIITIKIIHNNNIYQIQTVYAPNRPDRRGAFFEHVEDLLFPDCPLVQGGDFNMVENPQIDRFGGTPSNTHTKGLTELKQYKQKQQLIDIWREKNKDQRQFTWFAQQQNVNMIASRIDRFYVCTSFRKKYIRQEHTANPWSDHLTVSMTLLDKPNAIRGAGTWKANVSHFHDKECRDILDNFLTSAIQDPGIPDIQDKWNHIKSQVKRLLITYSSCKKEQSKNEIQSIQDFINYENSKPLPSINAQSIITAQEHIAQLKQASHNGSIIRSRERIIIDGEKPTRYFFAKEHTCKKYSTITKLRIKDQIIREQSEILKELHDYYAKLYSKQQLDEALQDQLL